MKRDPDRVCSPVVGDRRPYSKWPGSPRQEALFRGKISSMLVVMQSSARNEHIESVCDAGRAAGLDPTVFGGDPPMVLLTGPP
jgi:hypothetical protein